MLFNDVMSESVDLTDIDESVLTDYQRSLIIAEFVQLSDEEKEAFMESEQCENIVNEGLIGKNTFIQLSKADDFARRLKIASYNIAKEKGDPRYKKMIEFRQKEKALGQAILKTHMNKAKKIVKANQKQYIKSNGINRKVGIMMDKEDR